MTTRATGGAEASAGLAAPVTVQSLGVRRIPKSGRTPADVLDYVGLSVPEIAATAERLDPRTPLVTIEYAGAQPDYTEMLNYAVRAAENRYPDVQYDVISVVKDTSYASLGQERATDVMRAIMRDRVPASRIHLGLRTDPALTASQVRVYVR